MVSVLILTKDEEHDLAACLRSVAWSDDVHVLDSHSSDATATIATSLGAHLRLRTFDNYAAQRNAGLHETPFRHQWVLLVDADERIPEPLVEEMQIAIAKSEQSAVAFRIRRRDIWMGRWLRHAQISPYYVRLVRPDRVHYEREVNEVLIADGAIAELTEPFDHFPFSKGLRHWIDKHNRYSTLEASQLLKARSKSGGSPSISRALFDSDFHVRRFHQKELFYQMPFRPALKFAYIMLVRRAFLDGYPGIAYACLQSIYEYFIELKTRELESSASARQNIS